MIGRRFSVLKTREQIANPILTKRNLLVLDCVLLLMGILAAPVGKLLLALPFNCIFQKNGYLCPACGGTRAMICVIRGQFMDALHLNAYFVVTGLALFAGLVVLHISCFSQSGTVCRISRGIFHPYSAIVWAVGFLVFGILRNFI